MQPSNSVSYPTQYNLDRPLRVNNVARITGLCESAIRWNIRNKRLKAFTEPERPKILLVKRSDLDEFVARRHHA